MRVNVAGDGADLLVADVAPVAMHQQQPAEEGELAERVVRRHDRRATLAPADAAPDVRRLDHADVVGAVADGEGHSAHVLLHHVSHLEGHRTGVGGWGHAIQPRYLEHGHAQKPLTGTAGAPSGECR